MSKTLAILFLTIVLCTQAAKLSNKEFLEKAGGHPMLKNFGYRQYFGTTFTNGINAGLDLALNLDAGLSYRIKWGSFGAYMFSNPLIYFIAGGLSTVRFDLFYVKLNFYVDLVGYQFTGVDLQTAFNVDTYREFCFGM